MARIASFVLVLFMGGLVVGEPTRAASGHRKRAVGITLITLGAATIVGALGGSLFAAWDTVATGENHTNDMKQLWLGAGTLGPALLAGGVTSLLLGKHDVEVTTASAPVGIAIRF